MGKKVILKFEYMHKDEVCTTVEVLQGGKVVINDHTDNILYRAFGKWGYKATVNDVYKLLESRCFPRTRANCKELLKEIDLKEYNPRAIIEVTHGVLTDDFSWIRFEGEEHLKWKDVSKHL